MKKLLLILCCVISAHIYAENPADTIKKEHRDKPDTIKTSSFILPAALVTYGSLSFAVHPIRQFDYYVNGQLSPGIKNSPATYLVFVPVAAVYTLNLVGIQGEHDFVDRTALITLSAGFAGITDFSLKHLVNRHPPGDVNGASFPSGHTMGAFAAAEFLSQEYGGQSPAYTIAGYTVAVATGVLRLETHNHWFSEVVAGAGFGIASTRLAYLLYPSIKKWLTHTDKTGKSTFIMPTYQDGVPGLSFAKTF